MAKPQHCFYTVFKNVPYTDQEWERENAHRAKLSESQWYREKHPGRCAKLDTRPSHAFRYGPTAFTHKEAQKICENAIKELKAQQVGYSVWGPHHEVERWSLRKGGHWKKIN